MRGRRIVAVVEPEPVPKTRDEAEAAMGLIAALTIELNAALALQNAELIQARKRDPVITDLKDRIARHAVRLKAWATENRAGLGLVAEQPGDKKSLALRQGTIGWRWTNRAIKLLEGWTDALVLAKLRKLKRRAYIRIKHEVDRQQLLKDANPDNPKLTAAELRAFGVEVKREEIFFAEPNLES